MAAANAAGTVIPSVTWAQSPEIIFITIDVADVSDPAFEVGSQCNSLVVFINLYLLF